MESVIIFFLIKRVDMIYIYILDMYTQMSMHLSIIHIFAQIYQYSHIYIYVRFCLYNRKEKIHTHTWIYEQIEVVICINIETSIRIQIYPYTAMCHYINFICTILAHMHINNIYIPTWRHICPWEYT